ncbi:hypothetical protein [Paraburkholderia sp. RL17-337-BIB-A]|uniref:hypothetical protein n=1 Tax=Paraburkholderia sp. RL17-337-BIB-A TaxID=3031636 RepID=UPI0038B788B3
MVTPSDSSDAASEQAEGEALKDCLDREIALEERVQDPGEKALVSDQNASSTSRWSNPLIVAIFAASLAAIGSASVALINAKYGRDLEARQSEHARILEVIKTGDPDKAAINLDFLLSAGLIVDPDTQRKLHEFLKNRLPGTGPALLAQPPQPFESPSDFHASELVFLRAWLQRLTQAPDVKVNKSTLDEVIVKTRMAEQQVAEDRRSKTSSGKP